MKNVKSTFGLVKKADGNYGCAVLIVCATIVRDGRVLLVKHSGEQKPDYGYWLLPAGRVEAGESLEKALERETKEELGLRVKIVRKLVEHTDPYTRDRLANFLCTPSTTEIEVSAELVEAKWFDVDEIQRIEKIHPGLKQFLINGLQNDFFLERKTD